MNIIVCVDDNNGMMFNKRRVSQDVEVREDIYKNLNGKTLFMNSYSFKMFEKDNKNASIKVEENLPIDDKSNFQFIENVKLSKFEEKIDSIIVYYWNRKYPSDFKFDIDLSNWKLVSETEFAGKSHEKITKKVFTKTEKEKGILGWLKDRL